MAVQYVYVGTKAFRCQICHFSFVRKCTFSTFCQILSKNNIYLTTAIFHHFVSFLSKTKSCGALCTASADTVMFVQFVLSVLCHVLHFSVYCLCTAEHNCSAGSLDSGLVSLHS